MNTETLSQVPSFVVFHIGERRVALPREGVRELIASPALYSFPHTTPLVGGVVLRRGRILPVLDLGPRFADMAYPPSRFYLVVERNISSSRERCAIPVQGACELVTGALLPAPSEDGSASAWLDLNGEQIEILDLEKTIAEAAAGEENGPPPAEAMS